MISDTNVIAALETVQEPIAISLAAQVLSTRLAAGVTVVLCVDEPSRDELQILDADLIVVRAEEDFRNLPVGTADSYLVLASGLKLAREVLEAGLVSSDDRIIWALGFPFLETLELLGSVGLPADTAVCVFAGEPSSAVVVSEACEAGRVDFASFQAGLALSELGSADVPQESAVVRELDSRFRELATQHLNLLQTMAPAAAGALSTAEAREAPKSDDVQKMENDLILLKRRYDALNRKYNSLAGSKLGRLTLKMWERTRYSTGTAKKREAFEQ
ncbi:hypothetical protein DQ354_09500 [Arthrobacter sp. AQ5-06]|nr:hypothetical protein DQ354_09500 [Arthrobacter sp. AQ5-06]